MSRPFEPMLAERKLPDLESLPYPIYGSPKLDGIRCGIKNGQAVSRTLKPIKNDFIRNTLSRAAFEGLDGELIVGDPTDPEVYSITDSAVMTIKGEPDFRFFVFDDSSNPQKDYDIRLHALRNRMGAHIQECHHLVMHSSCFLDSAKEVLHYEDELLEEGYEGMILRHPNRPYKFGRSTMKEMGMLKLKRFIDEEFEIVGVEEQMHNSNEATTNELGRTKRSKAQEGMVPMGTLGALICKVLNGQTFTVDNRMTFKVGAGPGLTARRRQELWECRDTLPGQLAKVKFFPIGIKDRPRKPGLLGLRSKDDIS